MGLRVQRDGDFLVPRLKGTGIWYKEVLGGWGGAWSWKPWI